MNMGVLRIPLHLETPTLPCSPSNGIRRLLWALTASWAVTFLLHHNSFLASASLRALIAGLVITD